MIRKEDDIVGSLLQDIAHLVRQRIDKALLPHGLTRLKWLAIGLIQKNEGLTQSDLARSLELRPAATGKLVDRLVGRGLVERRQDAADRRVHRLHLTEKSGTLLKDLEPVGSAIREEVLQDLAREEREQLETTLKTLKRRLTTLGAMATAAVLIGHSAALPVAGAVAFI